MRVIFPNFLFEDSLSRRGGGRDTSLQRVMDSLAPLTGLMGRKGDVVVVSANGIPSDIPDRLSGVSYMTLDQISKQPASPSRSLVVIPWGWDSAARHLANSLGSLQTVPSEESVLTVNGRRFLADFDKVHDETGDVFFDGRFGRLCDDVSGLQAGIETLSSQGIDQWVAKPAFSAAGRTQMRGRSKKLSIRQPGWLRKQLDNHGYVYLEPWLPVVRECGIQLDISPPDQAGPGVELVGVTELITDRHGRYLGSLLSARNDTLWQPAVKHAVMIGRRAKDLGYFGPLGVDCMQVLLPGGRRRLRLCHDINGRLTMGRLALQLRCQLDTTNTGVWLHARVSDRPEDYRTAGKHPAIDCVGIVEVVKVSPGMIGNQPTAVDSWLCVTNGLEAAQNLALTVRRSVEVQK